MRFGHLTPRPLGRASPLGLPRARAAARPLPALPCAAGKRDWRCPCNAVRIFGLFDAGGLSMKDTSVVLLWS